jgi:replicative DNA helicase
MALMQLYPGKVYKVSHDKYKDANEFLQAGAAQSYKNAWYNARLYTPSNIFATESDFLGLYNESVENSYIPTNISALDDKILGLMRGHFTVIKAASGLGKSEFMRYLEYNFIKNYPDVKFASWHLEETKLRSLLGIVSYLLQDNVTRKDLIKTKDKESEVLAAIKHITENTGYMQFHMREEDGADELVSQIRTLTQVYGCQYIFFEPITDVVTTSDDKSKESILADLSIRLSKLAAELNVGIISIGHTNEAGEFKYCRMIGQRASVIIDLYRDRDSTNPIDRNTTKLLIRKNRPCGLEGDAGELYFNPDKFTLSDKHEGF